MELSKLENPEDVFCDDLVAWSQTVTGKKYYKVHKTESICSRVTETEKNTPCSIEIIRRPYTNKSDESLRKAVFCISNSNGQFLLVFIKYQFTGAPHVIIVKPHGNSKNQTSSYARTFRSTKNFLKEELEKVKPVQRAIFNVHESVGGLEKSQSVSALPRGENQAFYLQGKQSSAYDDPIYCITQAMTNYAENSKERYIRSYTNDDGMLKIVAFTEQQMNDIVNFCCNDRKGFKSLLFSDITFQLGPFYLLLTVYNNTCLFHEGTNACPVMLGPLMLCMLKNRGTYDTLFQKMSFAVPGLACYPQGYQSDCEKTLRNSMALAFSHSVGYICMIHGKKNISEKCSKLDLSNKLVREIKEDIFGQGGLIYARSSKVFDEQCRQLKNKWHGLESAEKLSSSFVQYFEKHKQEDIKDHMRVILSKDAGFGDQAGTTNPIESTNAVIKRWNNFQPKDAAAFLEDMLACVQEQANNVQKAFLNLPSKYNVREEFRDKQQRKRYSNKEKGYRFHQGHQN